MKNILILGAGISGLSLAWFFTRKFGNQVSITILESQDRPGGWIETIKRDGFLFEMGPRSLRASGNGLETLRLIEQLGMQDQVITADPRAKYRYLWMDSKLRALPTCPLSFLFFPLAYPLMFSCIRDLFTPPSIQEDESVYDFFKRRFGKTFAENFADPLVKGIYAGDSRKLSIASCFPTVKHFENMHGSVVRGILFGKRKAEDSDSRLIREVKKKGLFSLKGGLEELPKRLAFCLKDQIVYSAKVVGLSCGQDVAKAWLKDGRVFEADHIFSTLPARALPMISPILSSISYSSVAVVGLGYRKKVLKKRGFGYLIPSKEKQKVLGVVFDSCIFKEQNLTPDQTRLTVMVDALKEGVALELAKKALSEQLGIDAQPHLAVVKIAKQAIPQYLVGHAERVKELERALAPHFPSLTLHGSSFDGVAVNDCVAKAKQLVDQIAKNSPLNYS